MDDHDDQKLRSARARPIAMSRSRLGIEAAAETAAWRHGPAVPVRSLERPPSRAEGAYRGRGPHGYVRSPARIYEDLCDRLTDNPFVDASDVEVGIAGTEVTLNGTVNDPIALRQAQAIAEEVAGVSHVHNRLQLRPAGEREATPGDAVNAALGTGGKR
jgi:osmotically-inducible protein OsmY